MFDPKRTKSVWNYIPIILSLILGYAAGIILTFGIQYLDIFQFISNQKARFALVLFGMGILGATMYCTRFWARDIDEAIEEPEFLPNLFDFFGYVTTIIGGGITGIILYLFVLIGGSVVIVGSELPNIKFEAALIISFCGGLFHFKVQEALENFITQIIKQQGKPSAGGPSRTTKGNPKIKSTAGHDAVEENEGS